jgi:D-sedoheptulose 7-phosphate isomerase
MKNKIKEIIAASIDTKQAILEDEDMITRISATVDMMVQAFKKGNHIYFCGNGGSASDAQHLAAELSGRFFSIVTLYQQKLFIVIPPI